MILEESRCHHITCKYKIHSGSDLVILICSSFTRNILMNKTIHKTFLGTFRVVSTTVKRNAKTQPMHILRLTWYFDDTSTSRLTTQSSLHNVTQVSHLCCNIIIHWYIFDHRHWYIFDLRHWYILDHAQNQIVRNPLPLILYCFLTVALTIKELRGEYDLSLSELMLRPHNMIRHNMHTQ